MRYFLLLIPILLFSCARRPDIETQIPIALENKTELNMHQYHFSDTKVSVESMKVVVLTPEGDTARVDNTIREREKIQIHDTLKVYERDSISVPVYITKTVQVTTKEPINKYLSYLCLFLFALLMIQNRKTIVSLIRYLVS